MRPHSSEQRSSWSAQIDERKDEAKLPPSTDGYIIVPPYNDEHIIAGQGTIGLEILEEFPEVETVLAPVGGGGLISGVAAAIKLSNPKVKVIGVEPRTCCRRPSESTAGEDRPVPCRASQPYAGRWAPHAEHQSHQLPTHQHCVDDIITVTEDEICKAMQYLSANPDGVAEPSGAVSTAGFIFHAKELPRTTQNVAIISGGNIEPKMLEELRK